MAHFEIEITKGTSLFGDNSIIGRTLVIHEKDDTFVQPTGAAGSRLVCGIIKMDQKIGKFGTMHRFVKSVTSALNVYF